ncbi:MAG: 50S ribosomal protein L9 [Rhodobacteraceae bacterium]|nr:MAG: 50S ribosomal protein L9 [Paracoccaceae bacterium]
MQVVLLERVEHLGQMGDVVSVKDGYGRNFLLPQGKALRATKANLARFETERAQLEARNLDLKREAGAVAAKLDGQSFVVIRQASDGGALYGSVTARDAAEAATAGGFSVERRQIVLDRPVKELGLHPMRVVLHPEVAATITINVARSAEEAALQAQGKTIAELRAEEEAAEQAEFDVQRLFETADDEEGGSPRGMEVIDPDAEDDRR